MRGQPKSPRQEFAQAIDELKTKGHQVEILQPPRGVGENIYAAVKVDGSTQAWAWDTFDEEWK